MSPLLTMDLFIFVGLWLFWATRAMARAFKRSDRLKRIEAVLYSLVIVGVSGFSATALSAMGVLELPSSREWPAGYVRGVVTTADGKYIVPLAPPGRIQLYDPEWHFIRGWNVDAGGGNFKVQCSPDGVIEAFTEKKARHYSFTQDGHLVATERIPKETFGSLPTGETAVVPTAPLLWVFSNPFLSLGAAVIGSIGLAILKKIGDSATS
jgi:hypothetical protein